MQLKNTVYALHITEAYDDFEAESFLHEAINVTAKHSGEVSRFYERSESFSVPLWLNSHAS
ncbi:hypothetical protein YC2023_004712 [Brassica napus]